MHKVYQDKWAIPLSNKAEVIRLLSAYFLTSNWATRFLVQSLFHGSWGNKVSSFGQRTCWLGEGTMFLFTLLLHETVQYMKRMWTCAYPTAGELNSSSLCHSKPIKQPARYTEPAVHIGIFWQKHTEMISETLRCLSMTVGDMMSIL